MSTHENAIPGGTRCALSSSRATVGWFDHMAKDSRRIPVEEQCEVLSLIGDVAEDRDGPSLNVQVVVGLSDGTTRGDHLIEGRVFRRWRLS
jgi:uncharacterized protein